MAKNPALPSSSTLTCTNWPAMVYLAAWGPTSTKSRLSTGDDVIALLLVIFAGANETSFHPARTTRWRSDDVDDRVAFLVHGEANDERKDDFRSCAARLVTAGAWMRDVATQAAMSIEFGVIQIRSQARRNKYSVTL